MNTPAIHAPAHPGAPPNPFANYQPAKDQQPKTVRVTVRAAVGSVGWAGEVFGSDPKTFDAVPAVVEDLLKAPPSLLIQWPEGYVAPNGSVPGSHKLEKSAAASMTVADRIAIAEDVAHDAQARVVVAERLLAAANANHAAELGAAVRDGEAHRQRKLELEAIVAGAEQRAAEAHQALDAASKAHSSELHALKNQHTAALDTAKASHQAELDMAMNEVDRLTAELTARTEEVAALRAAIDAGAKPTPEPKPTRKVVAVAAPGPASAADAVK